MNERIVKLRKLYRLTQMDLAKKLNISDKVVSKWECGESEPSVSDLINLAKIFNVSLDYLAKGTISNSDKRILEKQPTTGELADDFLDQCKKIIRDKNLNKFKDLLLPQKVIGRAKPEYGEHVTQLVVGVFKGDKYFEWQNVYTPYLDIKKLLALDNYELYTALIDLPATFGELRFQLKQRNDLNALKLTEPKDHSSNDWTWEKPKEKLRAKDIKGLTDVRFYQLLTTQEDKNLALEELSENNKNYWKIIYTLILNGAYKEKVISADEYGVKKDKDILATQMLFEIAKQKMKN